jgi:Ca2+-binding EF-hand superfamily protein
MKIPSTTSSLLPASRAFLAQRATNRAPAAPNVTAQEPGTITGATGGPAQALPPQANLQGIFAAWGTPNPQYDVTKDGTVDAKDLAMFLGATEQTTTPQDVLDNWGQAGAGDINGDGAIDGIDLALALGAVQAPANQGLVDGVKKAWGTDNTEYDLTKDGTVDGADLAVALGGGSIAANGDVNSQAAGAATQVTNAVFNATDLDNDGAISTGEAPQVAKFLSKLDANNSGTIAKTELQDKLSTEFASLKSQRPTLDLNSVASRWIDSLLGRGNPQVNAARSAYQSSRHFLATGLKSILG